MNVITRRRLKEFAAKHRDAASPLDSWHRVARKARSLNLAEVREAYPHADMVGSCTVFNIGGNKYRLIVKIAYRAQAIYIKRVLTHKEYDKGDWKSDCQ